MINEKQLIKVTNTIDDIKENIKGIRNIFSQQTKIIKFLRDAEFNLIHAKDEIKRINEKSEEVT